MEGKSTMNAITLTLTADDCLNLRLALNLTACHWGDKATAHLAADELADFDTCQRLRTKYHELWERVAAAQRLAEAEARADNDMFASEAREATRPGDRAVAQWFADDAAAAGCCRFHSTGGNAGLSCGGDEALRHVPERALNLINF
jgi:hypothetical protein